MLNKVSFFDWHYNVSYFPRMCRGEIPDRGFEQVNKKQCILFTFLLHEDNVTPLQQLAIYHKTRLHNNNVRGFIAKHLNQAFFLNLTLQATYMTVSTFLFSKLHIDNI